MTLKFFAQNQLIGERWHDGGGVYAESDFSRLIVEPWNCATAFMFLAIVGYWVWRLKGKLRRMPYMAFALIMLTIGGIGGGLYHGFRSSPIFLVMDFLPIVILVFSAGVFFLNRLYAKPLMTWGIIALLFGAQGFIWHWIGPSQLTVNAGYAFMAAVVVVPSALWAKRTDFYAISNLLWAVVSFGIALIFRILDKYYLLPMGTHFLWHIFGAIACALMLNYIYETVYANPKIVFTAFRRLMERRMGRA